MTGNFTRPTVCSIISFVMSFPLESGCKSRGFGCNSQIYWKVFFIILKQFYWMRWLSAMLDNIFFQTSWNDVFLYTFIIYIARSEVRPITSKNPGKREKLHGETAETARGKGKTSGQNGKDDWKYRERNRETPAGLQKNKGPGTANFRKKFRNKRKTILKIRKTAEGRQSKDAPDWRKKTRKQQNGRRFSSKVTE